MRVILDTNVLVSAFISRTGNSARVLDVALTLEDVQLVLSEQIIREFVRVMSRDELLVRFDYTLANIGELARLLRKTSHMIEVRSEFKAVKEDPSDNTVLNAAYDGKCEFVVSGDHHLLNIKKFKGITILSPRQMLELLSRRYGSFVSSKAIGESSSDCIHPMIGCIHFHTLAGRNHTIAPALRKTAKQPRSDSEN